MSELIVAQYHNMALQALVNINSWVAHFKVWFPGPEYDTLQIDILEQRQKLELPKLLPAEAKVSQTWTCRWFSLRLQ